MSNPNIARYLRLLSQSGYFEAWMQLGADVEASAHADGSANDTAVDELLDAFGAAHRALPARTIEASRYWRLLAESASPSAGDEDEDEPVKLTPVKQPSKTAPGRRYSKNKARHLRLVGDY